MILQGVAAGLLAALSLHAGAARAQEAESLAAEEKIRREIRFLSSSAIVRVGHWLEVKGELREDGLFHGEEAEVKAPERDELLIGTVASFDRGRGRFELLGQPVVLVGSTEFDGVAPRSLGGQRVQVEGEYKGPAEFEADEVEPQSEGKDGIGGRVEEVNTTAGGVVVRIMRYSILLPPTIEHEAPLDAIGLAPRREVAVGDEFGLDEDDLFGRGVRLTEKAILLGQIRLESAAEENFDLDREDPEDREDREGAMRFRLQWRPTRTLSAVGELRASGRHRDDEEEGTSTVEQLRPGEVFLYYSHPSAAFDLQLGRQDFDDEREWIYDRNLDGLRVIEVFFPWRLELSATTTLSDGSARDEDSTNWIGYLSREQDDRHLALYVVHRRIDGEQRELPTHLGFRLLGDDDWLDLAWLTGEVEGGRELGGWGLDLGRTFKPKALRPVYLTLAYAIGSGGGKGGGTDRTFRQTGLQDNNGRFGGVTSFRYYGELADPELANLHVATVGIGARLARRASLDLVGHYYRQDEPSEFLVSEIDEDPDGVDRELGWEIDLVYGDRRWESWGLEIIGAYFAPGDAFSEQDGAFLGKVQVRFRF
jgi:alginate production protein